MAGTYDDRYNKAENATRYIKQRVSDVSPTSENDDDSSTKKTVVLKPALLTSILAGGFAGVVVDIGLFPLDTIKTRRQSEVGFIASGGFRGIYKGIIPVLLSSAPLSALFFATYNTVVNTFKTENTRLNPLVYFVAATAAEVLCASARVPLEIVKQRQQISGNSALSLMKNTYTSEGLPGFYRGFGSTLLREIPFAAIQYPLWEYMINEFIIYQNGESLTPLQIAYCGAAAGGIAAALTTPMDVIKTRIMLANKEKILRYKNAVNYNFAREVYRDRGIIGFFAGVVPRVLWITLGGFIYFGAYEKARIVCEKDWCKVKNRESEVNNAEPSYFEGQLEKLPHFVDHMCKVQTKARSIFHLKEKPGAGTKENKQNETGASPLALDKGAEDRDGSPESIAPAGDATKAATSEGPNTTENTK